MKMTSKHGASNRSSCMILNHKSKLNMFSHWSIEHVFFYFCWISIDFFLYFFNYLQISFDLKFSCMYFIKIKFNNWLNSVCYRFIKFSIKDVFFSVPLHFLNDMPFNFQHWIVEKKMFSSSSSVIKSPIYLKCNKFYN